MRKDLPVVVIPAYQPDETLLNVIQQLIEDAYTQIIIVNDGSSPDRNKIFEELSSWEHVTVLHHAKNLGKGQALKTAFNYVLLNFPDSIGVITVDADGQHLPDDVKHVANDFLEHPSSLCLGVREFTSKIPLRSLLGNMLTKVVFWIFTGKYLKDTQTGLRGIPASLLPRLLDVKSGGYDFEMEMLIFSLRNRLSIQQITIKTVYEEDNKSSHFNPIVDSLKIYFVFLRFLSASLVTSLIDMILFSIAFYFSSYIFFSIVFGRIGAGIFNFLAVKMVVFKSRGKLWWEALKYVSLVILLMLISYGLITTLVLTLGFNPYVSKIISESILFIASFAVQRTLVFANN